MEKKDNVVLKSITMTLNVDVKAYEKDNKVYEYIELSTTCYGVPIPLVFKEEGTSVSKALMLNKVKELSLNDKK